MDDGAKMVRVPEDMFRQLERRAMRLTEIEQALISASEILAPYQVTGVMTSPPTGADAGKVFTAVANLISFARGIK